MDTDVKRTQRDYTMAFKLAVVEQVEKGELTYKQAQDRYGIQGSSTVLKWMRKHGRQSWGRAASSATMLIDKTPKPLTPEQQIADLTGANDVVIVEACQLGLEALRLQLRDVSLDGLSCAVLEGLGEVVAVLDRDLNLGAVLDGCHDAVFQS